MAYRNAIAATLLMIGGWHLLGFGMDPNQVTPGVGYVLLQSGVVLHGNVVPQGVDVLIEDGSAKIVMKASEIRHISVDKEGLYKYQIRNSVRLGEGEHIHLASWCLDNGLLDLAGEHYMALKSRNPNAPHVKQLDAKLRQKLLDDELSRRAFGLAPKTTPPASVADQAVRHASSTEIEPTVGTAVAVEYREGILPLFRNRCGQAGCHGSQGKADLIFPQANAMAFSLMQKSLQSTLAYVNKKDPTSSRLIKMATTAHGLQTKPAFDVSQNSDAELLARVHRWLQMVERDGQAPVSPSPILTGVQLASNPSAPAANNSNNGVVTLVPVAPSDQTPAEGLESKELKRLDEAIRALEQREKNRSPKDPFDPEAFNRQYAPGPK